MHIPYNYNTTEVIGYTRQSKLRTLIIQFSEMINCLHVANGNHEHQKSFMTQKNVVSQILERVPDGPTSGPGYRGKLRRMMASPCV